MVNEIGKEVDITIDLSRVENNTIEKVKLAKLLVALDNGCAERFAMEHLTNIELEGRMIFSYTKHFLKRNTHFSPGDPGSLNLTLCYFKPCQGQIDKTK